MFLCRKQATVGSHQCHKLEHKLAERERELVNLRLEAAEAATAIQNLEDEADRQANLISRPSSCPLSASDESVSLKVNP